MTLAKDTILENRYRIDCLLGQGGMGAIYQGYDLKLDIPLAIKENFFQTPQSVRQFQQEARILARLHHPNLPRVIDHFSFENRQYLVMDFIEGQDLWEIVKKQKQPLEEKLALDYLIQVCQAVNYLHQQIPPIIHRDIKPQNIKITPEGRAILVDFGIAKMAEGDGRTNTGAQGVTPGFSPPEQYSGTGTTPVSDIYALGATLYAILTGKKPPDSISLLTGGAKFESPNTINPKLSRQASQAIEKAMQTQQTARPPSVTAWQQELIAVLETQTRPDLSSKRTAVLTSTRISERRAGKADLPSMAQPISTPKAGRGILPLVTVIVILLGIVGVVVYFNLTLSPVTPTVEVNPKETSTVTQEPPATTIPIADTPFSVSTQIFTPTSLPNAVRATDTSAPTLTPPSTDTIAPTITLPPTNTPSEGLTIPQGKGALIMFNCLGGVVNVDVLPVNVFQELAPKTGSDCIPGEPIFLDPGEYTLKASIAGRASEGQAVIIIEAGGVLNFDWQ